MEKTENEKKKEFLWSYRKAKKDMERFEVQLAELRLNKLSPAAINNDGMPHGSQKSDLSDYAARLDEIEKEIIAARYKRISAFQRVRNAIEMLDNEDEKDLLTYRYINGLKWEEVAVKIGYSWKQTHRIHRSALKNLKMT